MCLMCEEEDLYFLYLERLEQEKRRAAGETAPANANWLWPALGQSESERRATATDLRVDKRAKFICDAPGDE